jgi:hypothetical protein
VTETPVVVEATTRQFESWKGVAVVAETLGSSGWALAGGQMVALHLLIAHLPFPRVTIDADTIVDVRVRPDAARLASAGLVGAGWMGSGVDNTVHRFISPAGGIVDILGPDGLRSRPITIPPATTLLAPGGTQLLRRAAEITITVRNGTRSIAGLNLPLPSRLAALIGKSAALGLPDGRDRHLFDAIHLAATLRPADLVEPLSKADRRWLRNLLQHVERGGAWTYVDDEVQVLARASMFRISTILG